jgi:hypothetical protein
MVNLHNMSTPRLLTLDSARPMASAIVVRVFRRAHLLLTGPDVKSMTARCIEIDLVQIDGQFKCLTVAHFDGCFGMSFWPQV